MYVKRHGFWHYAPNLEFNKWIEQADVSSFRVLSAAHAVDANHAYWFGEAIEQADPASFVALSELMAKDNTQVFLQNSECFSELIDVATFESLGGTYYRDANNVYCIWYSYDSYDCHVVACDQNSFRVIDETFAVDANSVFNHGAKADLDAASFERLNLYFARDVNDVYFLRFGGKNSEHVAVEPLSADPKTFRLLNDRYARDATSVFFFYNCHSLARQRYMWIECSRVEVDADAFRVLGRRDDKHDLPDATDGRSLFIYGKRLPLDDFCVEQHKGEYRLVGADLDAVYALIAGEEDPTTLGPIDHPTRIRDEYRRWWLAGDECRLSDADRASPRARLRRHLQKAWLSLTTVEEFVAMRETITAHGLVAMEWNLLIGEAEKRSLETTSDVELHIARYDFLFTLPVAQPKQTWIYTMNNVICRALECADPPLTPLERWADVAREHTAQSINLPHNLACVYALVGRTQDALAMCELAMSMGYQPWKTMRDDSQLRALHDDPRFAALFEGAEEIVEDPDEDIPF